MKNIILKSCLIALCLICGLGNAWGETVTFTTNAYNGKGGASGSGGIATATISGVTLSSTKAYYTEAHIREYSGGTITLSSENKITQIEITSTASGTSSNGPGKISLKSGCNGTYSYSGTVGTWKYNSGANEIVFNCDAQFRWTKMVVTYESSTPTARTVTFDAGTNGTCSTNSLTEASAGAGVTLPSCTPHTNYTFVGWSTSSTPTSADAGTAGENYKPSSDCTLYAYYTYQAPAYTVTLGDNSSTLTEAEGGAGVTLPTRSDVGNYTFAGWSETNVSTETTTAPTIIEAGIYNPTSNITLYPVYTRSEGGSTSGWVEVTTEPFEEGDYVILGASSNSGNTHYIMKASISSNRFENSTININSSVTPNTLAAEPTSNCIWNISKPDDYYRIKNGTKFAGGTSSKNQGALLTDSSADLAKWIISISDKTIINYGRQSKTDPNNKFLSNNGEYGWATYASTGGTAPRLFKHETGTTYYISDPTSADPIDATWSVDPASVTVTEGSIATATIDTNYDGTLSVVSNDESKATVTINDKVITVTGVAAGTTTLTVTGDATSNFNAISKTIDVTVTASSATTPAFAYFEETATINVGEILEAKDYCGTIAPDAGFDDYSISTAVCSAIDADDDNKLSDDYACIYSKVSFKKAGTYVVHVTAPAVEGKYTASEGYITVTVTGPTLYKVTIETPENGTLIVKHGDDTVESGDEFAKDERLDITVTPDEGYKFRNWQAVDNTTRTYTTSFKYIIGESDVTISANFDELATYAINFSINGNIATQNLKEGADVTVPTAEEVNAARPTGVTKVFTGWVITPTVDADTEPEYVTPVKATANATYYAVFATKTGSGSGTGGDYELVESNLEDWTGEYIIAGQKDKAYLAALPYASGNNNVRSTDATVTDNKITSDGAARLTVTKKDGYYTIKDGTNYWYAAGGSSNNYMKGNSSIPTSNYDTYLWTISYTNNKISIVCKANISRNTIKFNQGNNPPLFSCYEQGKMSDILLFKKSATTGGTTYSDFTTLPYLQLNEANTSIVALENALSDKVEVARTMKADTWNTFCLPFSLTEEEIESQLGENAEVMELSSFSVTGEDADQILHMSFTAAETIEAGKLYMVCLPEGKSTITVEKKEINTTTAPNSHYDGEGYTLDFVGTYTYLEGSKNEYVPYDTFIISSNKFLYVNSNAKLKGFRGYIKAVETSTGNPVKALSFGVVDPLTGISNVEIEGLNNVRIYNLQGQMMNKLQKGINIVNGKKVIR